MFKQNLIKSLPAIILSSLLVITVIYAWQEPLAAPPGGNLPPPLHQGSAIQTKTGGLNLMGNVGIGTTGPTTRLDVDGQIRIRGGSPAAGRILTSAADGTATWAVPAGGLPTGTSGQTLRHDGTSWVVNNNIFNTETNVGIGTIAPTTRLDVDGQIRIRGGSPAAGRVLTSAADGTATWTVPAGGLPTGTSGQTLRHDGTSWIANSVLFNNGTNVGIGTTAPGHLLDVGNMGITANITNNIRLAGRQTGTDGIFANLRLSNSTDSGGSFFGVVARRELNNFGVSADFTVNSTGAGATPLTAMTLRHTGNVGIGTTAPTSRLQISDGDLRLQRTHLSADTGTWAQSILFTDELNRIGARIIGRRTAWSGAPMAISFETGGLDSTTERMRITSAGNVGIGTTEPGQRLQIGVAGDGTSAVANAWNLFSDIRLKTNIIPLTDVLSKLSNVNPVKFNWKNDDNKENQIGFIAQEIEEVFPALVSTDNDGYKSVDYSKFSAVLVSAIKELKVENEQLKSRIEVLENR